jgi:putative addiction module killer protein
MLEIIQSKAFKTWLLGLRDKTSKARIEARIRRLTLGHFGDVKPVRDGISELRIDFGPGYRVYFIQHDSFTVVLLAGGDKHSQDSNIEQAIKIAKEWRNKL